MELIDTHAHVNFDDFDKDLDQVLDRARAEGVVQIINVGTDIKASAQSIALAKKYDFIYATCGIHPTDTPDIDIESETQQLTLLAENKKVVAVGECGLDFYRQTDSKERDRQKLLFKTQIQIAQARKLPLIVHSRDAWEDTLQIVKASGQKKGVFHSWTYPPEITKQALGVTDFYFAFNGIITFKNAPRVQESVKLIPMERLLLETDCPFLSPSPHRGLRNEPSFVRIIATQIATLTNTDPEVIAQATTQNARLLFNL